MGVQLAVLIILCIEVILVALSLVCGHQRYVLSINTGKEIKLNYTFETGYTHTIIISAKKCFDMCKTKTRKLTLPLNFLILHLCKKVLIFKERWESCFTSTEFLERNWWHVPYRNYKWRGKYKNSLQWWQKVTRLHRLHTDVFIAAFNSLACIYY